MKINWLQKLTSRKLWTSLVGFVSGLLIYFGKTAEETEAIAALILAFASLLAYILAEGLVDANRLIEETYVINKPPDEDGVGLTE